MTYYKNGNITTSPTIPNVIAPSHETILANGWYVYVDNPPSYDSPTEKLVRGEVIEGVVQYEIVALSDGEIKERIASQNEAKRQEEMPEILIKVSQLVTAERILNETLPKERISEFAKVFDEPRAGQVYKKDWILRDPLTDELFAVIKEKVTFQAHWKMGDIASEFKPFRDDAVVNAWVQPLSTNPYPLGAKVTHRGFTWESMHPANVWEPGGVGIGDNIWKKI